MANKKIRLTVYTALFLALVAVTTFAVKIPLPTGGYIHIGDSINYLASLMLPFPLGMVAGSVGGALADTMGGYYNYIIPTLIVKLFNSLCFYVIRSKGEKLVNVKSMIALALSSVVTVVGYYIVSIVLYGTKGSLATIPGNAVQAIGSAVIFVVLAIAFDKTSLKKRLKL